MFVDLDKLEVGCPKDVEEEMKEIKGISVKFIDYVDIVPNQDLEEVKVDVQDAKNALLQIMSRFLTLISNLLEEETDLKKIGIRLKFEEDIGSVIQELKEKNTGKIEKMIGITSLLKFAGELKTTYDFLIYHPIITANKSKENDTKKYIANIFKTLRTNASILGHSGRFTLQPSKQILPKPIDMIKSGSKRTEPIGKGLKELEGLGEEEGESDEEEEDEGEEEGEEDEN